MILFVSGRCDIPAFYSEWFFQRVKEGFVDVRNPFNPHQISRIPLHPHHIDAMFFCTKNPIPMLERLDEIDHLPYVFHITLTPYHTDIEPHIVDKKKVINAIKTLKGKIGKERVILRYDPILLSDSYTIDYHLKAFDRTLSYLCDDIDRCIISFVDSYKNTKANMAQMKMHEMDEAQMHLIGKGFGEIAQKYNVKLQTCSEAIDLSMYGISQEGCVTKQGMERLLQRPYEIPTHKSPRSCNCLPFVDIGDYNSCAHLCKYCYANYDELQVLNRMKLHEPTSSVLLGNISEEDHITWRKEPRARNIQLF